MLGNGSLGEGTPALRPGMRMTGLVAARDDVAVGGGGEETGRMLDRALRGRDSLRPRRFCAVSGDWGRRGRAEDG